MQTPKEPFGFAALAMEAVGVATIVLGSVYVVAHLLWRRDDRDRYGGFRRNPGRAIILGLEFLIAGDSIRTVAVAPALQGELR